MNHPKSCSDDPQFTAYALGELSGDERAAVEAALRHDPALRAEIDEIRAAAAALAAVLAREAADGALPGSIAAVGPLAALPGEAHASGWAAAPVKPGAPAGPTIYDEARRRRAQGLAARVFQFPRFYFVAAGLAASVLAVLVAIQRDEYATREQAQTTMARIAHARRVAEQQTAAWVLTLPAMGPRDFSDDASGAPARAVARTGPRRSASGGTRTADFAIVSDPAGRAGVVVMPTPREGGGPGPVAISSDPRDPPAARPGIDPPAAPARSESLRIKSFDTEIYAQATENPFERAEENPLSTFSVDADTASYANIRRLIQQGTRPPPGAVRIEELLNYFPFRYPAPTNDAPFAASLEVASAPWAPAHRLVRIGLKGREVSTADRPPANLVFLLDVSASMEAPNKLPLVKQSLRLLVNKLRADDRVAIVTYAGQSGLALPSTPAAESATILRALDGLETGGATNGALGIHLAYDIAKANFARDGINRVILCTDGDFNVGLTSPAELVRLIEEKAGSGVFLTVLGFGMGNLKDSTLEYLADRGNGIYGYVDSRQEAEKLFVEQVNGTLLTVAKDVKIQVEFNPAFVASYRLIGYENRLLRKEARGDEAVDAGEIGAGHTVTALYEIVPLERESTAGRELLTVRVRFKAPGATTSERLDFPLADQGRLFGAASPDFRFAAAVAEFGMILRGSPYKGSGTLADVMAWAAAAIPGTIEEPQGHWNDFIDLVRKTQGITE